VLTGLLLNYTTTLGSSLPSGAISSLNEAFRVSSNQQSTLPVAVFLVGYIFGPIVFGPMSESYGRKICFISSFGLYTIFTMACALTTSWPLFLLFRFLVGSGASAPQAVLGGMYSDIYPDLVHRGRAVMILGLTSNIGPLLGPVIAGYVSTYKWQWIFWINLIMCGLIWPLLLLLPG
jgi:MFS family permease